MASSWVGPLFEWLDDAPDAELDVGPDNLFSIYNSPQISINWTYLMDSSSSFDLYNMGPLVLAFAGDLT